MIPVGALSWLKSPDLLPLWHETHARLLRNGRTATGRLTLTSLTDQSRVAVGQLLGYAVRSKVTIDLAKLDQRLLGSAAGAGLIEVVEAIVGVVPDRRTEASVDTARRALLRDHAEASLAAAGLADYPWAAEWLDRMWRAGLPARHSSEDVRGLISQAATTLGLTVGPHARLWSRGELAQRVTGTAHGLDDDTPLARIVLRGISLAIFGDAEPPASATGRRALWEAAGVAGDTVATTVLVYGLRPLGDDWRADHLRIRALSWAESHLTLREVRRLSPLRLVPQTVFVCENPRVLEAAADAQVPAALICSLGNPTTVTLALLDTIMASSDVRLAYHGDFDWPGIAMADRMIRRYAALPWRFGAADYHAAVAVATERGTPLQPLTGTPVATGWDPALGTGMAKRGVAVHEEEVIETLLGDLN